MNETLLKQFSDSAQKALRLLGRSPEDASHFNDRLQILRSGLLIGAEVLERTQLTVVMDGATASVTPGSRVVTGTRTTFTLLQPGRMRLGFYPDAEDDEPEDKSLLPFRSYGIAKVIDNQTLELDREFTSYSVRTGIVTPMSAARVFVVGPNPHTTQMAASVLACTTALECCMTVLEQLHPGAFERQNQTSPRTAKPLPGMPGFNGARFRPLDLDPDEKRN